MDATEIPPNKHFKIGEVARLFDLEPYVLRYWETEFDQLSPRKTASGQRSYDKEDIELIDTIRHLLYVEMYTIAGARRQLERAELLDAEITPGPTRQDLEALRSELDLAHEDVEGLERENQALRDTIADLEASVRTLEAELDAERQVQPETPDISERLGRQRRVLLEVRRELQAVSKAARVA